MTFGAHAVDFDLARSSAMAVDRGRRGRDQRSASTPPNVVLELQSRQWRQVEGWDVRRLGQLAEERSLLGLRDSVSPSSASTPLELFTCSGKPFSGAARGW